MSDDKTDAEIDLNYVKTMFGDELAGIDIEIREREIGNGPQFALEAYRDNSTVQVYESRWYHKSEFTAFMDGMKQLERLLRIAERERDD